MQHITLRSCCFNQIAVTIGEWITVCNDGTDGFRVSFRTLEVLYILFDSIADIFHQQNIGCFNNWKKSQIGKHCPVFGFGKDKEMLLSHFGGMV